VHLGNVHLGNSPHRFEPVHRLLLLRHDVAEQEEM